MLLVIWAFTARPERRAEFERRYGPAGDWARLFRQSPGYLGTELLKEAGRRGRYLTIDRWAGTGARAAFLERHRAAYRALDLAFARLTRDESLVGCFETPRGRSPGPRRRRASGRAVGIGGRRRPV